MFKRRHTILPYSGFPHYCQLCIPEMEENCNWRLQSDWYSPTRLHGSPVKYDFPGDRFIPNRSLMNLDQARSLLTSKITEPDQSNKFSDNYRKKLKENLTLDTEGRPFRMLVFRGSPKNSRKSCRLIDELRQNDEQSKCNPLQQRTFPEKASRILDAPNLKNDYYLDVMDWGSSNYLAVALGTEVYTLNVSNGVSCKLVHRETDNDDYDYPASLAWSHVSSILAVGHLFSDVILWDVETSKPIRFLQGHQKRVGSLAWNGSILTSGSSDKAIINHDVRARKSLTSYIKVHKSEVTGLKWSLTGDILASGGNDNQVYVWHSSKMSSSSYIYRLKEHCAAVKALAWCPYNYDVLATGGGTMDGCIKLWNINNGTCNQSISTQAQITGLLWNRHHNEILSGHGHGNGSLEMQNQLCLWKYPSMSKIGKSKNQDSRIVHISQSPDGVTVASAEGNETVCFWEIFGPPKFKKSRTGSLDNLLSLKESPIR